MKAWNAVVSLLLTATVMLGLNYPVSAEPRQQLCIENTTDKISATDVQKTAAAIQIQLDRDFSPHWGVYADLSPTCDLSSPAWRVFLDPGDNSMFYGFHDEKAGVPFAVVFTGDASVPWSAIASHEIVEMLIDPGLDEKIKVVARPDGNYVALELCDAVARSSDKINDVVVSDFLLPDWFKTGGSGPYDMLWLVQQPFTDYDGRTYVTSTGEDMSVFNVVVLPDSLH